MLSELIFSPATKNLKMFYFTLPTEQVLKKWYYTTAVTQSEDIPPKNPAIRLVESSLCQDSRRRISQDIGFAQEDIENNFLIQEQF